MASFLLFILTQAIQEIAIVFTNFSNMAWLQSECQQLICEVLRATPDATSADAAVQTARMASKVPSKDKRQGLAVIFHFCGCYRLFVPFLSFSIALMLLYYFLCLCNEFICIPPLEMTVHKNFTNIHINYANEIICVFCI